MLQSSVQGLPPRNLLYTTVTVTCSVQLGTSHLHAAKRRFGGAERRQYTLLARSVQRECWLVHGVFDLATGDYDVMYM